MKKLTSRTNWPNIFSLAISVLFIQLSGIQAQDNYSVKFKSGTNEFSENILDFVSNTAIPPEDIFQGQYFRYIQFVSIPLQEVRQNIENRGIRFLEYIPNNTYLVAIPAQFDVDQFLDWDIRSVARPEVQTKVDVRLLEGDYPDWVINENDVEVIVKYQNSLSKELVTQAMFKYDIQVIESSEYYPLFRILISSEDIPRLADEQFVNYIEPIPAPDVQDDFEGRSLHRSNVIDADYNAGRQYDGTGVNILVRDDGTVGPHIDFEGRLNQVGVAGGTHGDGVAGVFAAAGNIDPSVKGMAPGALVYVRDYISTFLDGTLDLHLNEDVMITISSYSNGCNAGYTMTTQTVDQHIYENPSLLHVFSAGNSNGSDCGYGAGTEWGNITGGHKQGKNVIAVANLYEDETLVGSSSRGPAHDGRIKPDISSHGEGQMSTDPDNTYAPFGGTSAAAPCIAGVTAQLYHAYKDLNGGTNPESALIKSLMLNTAEDLGNTGPDFKYGWGRINAMRAVETLENSQYMDATVSQGGFNTHSVTVPAGVEEVRIMLYWSDKEAAASASPALVNNLDLQVTDPSSTMVFPWILDPTPNPVTLDLPATNGVDNLNNVEQVAITSPQAGTYSVRVDGTTVPFGPQKYYIVYYFITDAITLTYPQGGEGFVPGTIEFLRWDAFGTSGMFTLEYSLNNGSTWTLISNTIPGTERQFLWSIPPANTGEALVKISRSSETDQSNSIFSILDKPVFTVSDLCFGGVSLSWSAVPGAVAYDIFQLGNKYMDSVGTSPGTGFDITGLIDGQTYWFSVRTRTGSGAPGRRANAISHQVTGSGVCPIPDVALMSIKSPSSVISRNCTGLGFSDVEEISVFLYNLGNTNLSNINVSYQLNGGPAITEVLPAALNSGDTLTYTFATPADMSGAASHEIIAWLSHPQSSNLNNDTVAGNFNFLANPPIVLPFTEGFELAEDQEYLQNMNGISGVERVDFETSNPGLGRLRTNAGLDFPKSGSRAATLDVNSDGNYATNYLILTFNLENYIGSPDMQLNFSFMHHGEETDPNDMVWVHGSPEDPWIAAYDWGSNLPASGLYETICIDLSGVLSGAGQDLSCLTQVRFGQEDNYSATSITSTDGITVDDIRILEKNLEMEALIKPSASDFCGRGSDENITIRINNARSSSYSNIPVAYKINGGSIVSEMIVATIPGNSSMDYTFVTQADLSLNGDYIIETWIEPFDGDPSNDSLSATIKTFSAITSFPYTQNFDGTGFTPTGNLGDPIIMLDEGWVNDQDDSPQDWTSGTGATPSTNTGPDNDHTSGNGNYLYTEDSSPYENDSIILLSPCFDLNMLCKPTMTFWYHSHNTDQPLNENFMHVDIILDDGSIARDIVPPIGHDSLNDWRLFSTDLSPYKGVVSVRFRSGTNGGSYTHDIAIDDFQISDDDLGQNIVYVDSSSAGGNGLSWGQALNTLQEALTLATSCDVDTVWVAEGTYFPDPLDRTISFDFSNSIILLGGFQSGGSNLFLRNPGLYETRMSGDIGVPNSITDNSYHIIKVDPAQVVEIDGFNIASGNANGAGDDSSGAAVLSNGIMTLKNVIFSDHSGTGVGTVIKNSGTGAILTLDNCTLISNTGTTKVSNDNNGQMIIIGTTGIE